MAKLLEETLIKFSKIPAWHERNIGHRVNRSTCHRWRVRGCRGAKLETILVGGVRYTSIEAINRFVAATTTNADGAKPACSPHTPKSDDLADAEEYLRREGILSETPVAMSEALPAIPSKPKRPTSEVQAVETSAGRGNRPLNTDSQHLKPTGRR